MKALINFFTVWLITLILLGSGLLSLDRINEVGQEFPSSIRFLTDSIPYEPVDDFNGDSSPNCDNEQNGGKITCTLVAGYVAISYDVTKQTNPNEPSYAWLQNNLKNTDLSAWEAVWIIIEGKNGGEKLYAEFAECDNPTYQKIEIRPYIFGGITTTRRAALIPFEAFTQVKNWSCIQRFSIIAHSAIPSGKGEVHVDDIRLLPSTVVIDDFNDLIPQNNELGAGTGPWCDNNAPLCGPTGIVTPTQANGDLKLEYNVSPANVEGGFWTKVLSSKLLSYTDVLFLEVKGEQGGEKVWIEIKGCDPNNDPEIMIGDYLPAGITTEWQLVAIPLAAFVDISSNTRVDRNCIDQIALNLWSKNSGEKSGQGTVYFDNIRLASISPRMEPIPVIVDNFNDCNTWNALSRPWKVDGNLTFIYDETNRVGNYGCSYRMAYNVTLATSGYTWAEFYGLDLTGYDHLEFFIKGKTGSEIVRICLRERTPKKPQDPPKEDCEPLQIVATQTWQFVRIPLSKFPNINLTDLDNLKFAFEGEPQASEVYVDNINFIKLQESKLPIVMKKYPLTELTVFNDNTGGDLTFYVRDRKTKANIIPPCKVPNNETKFCGTFPSGVYEVQAFTVSCGNPKTPDKHYAAGPVTTRVFCDSN